MDAASMSLEDIIKTKQTKKPSVRPKANGKTRYRFVINVLRTFKPRFYVIVFYFFRFPTVKKQQRGNTIVEKPHQLYTSKVKRLGGAIGGGGVIIDARNKIVQKNRSKIRDARDKLAQIAKRSGDARQKLNSKRTQSAEKYYSLKKSQPLPRQASYERRRMAPPAYDHMDMDEEYMPPGIALRRTVQNEIAYTKMPPLPTFQRSVPSYHPHQVHHMRTRSPPPPQSVSASLWNSDPFDCYEVPIGRPADVSEPKNLQRHIRNVGADILPRKGILRSTRDRAVSITFYIWLSIIKTDSFYH